MIAGGFTLVEILLAMTIGSVIVATLAQTTYVFGQSMTELRGDAGSDLARALEMMARKVRTAWLVENRFANQLITFDALGRRTTFALDGQELEVTQPTGASGILLTRVAKVSFDFETVRRLREATPLTVVGRWSNSSPGGPPSSFRVQQKGDDTEFGFGLQVPSSRPGEVGQAVPDVEEQLIDARVQQLVLTLSDVDTTDYANLVPQPCNHGHCHFGETGSHWYCHTPGDPGDACWKRGHQHPAQCGVVGSGAGTIVGDAVYVPGGGAVRIDLHQALRPGSGIPTGAPLARTSLAKGITPDGGAFTLTNCSGITPNHPPNTKVPIDLTAFAPIQILPGDGYSLVFKMANGGNMLAIRNSPSGSVNPTVALKRDGLDWEEVSYDLPYAVVGTRTYTQTEEHQVVSSVTITIELATGESMSATAAVIGQVEAEDPWLGAVFGELPTLVGP